MIDESGYAITVNHPLAIGQAEEICPWRVLVNIVRLVVGQLRAGVFDYDVALLNGGGGVHTIGMDLRSANYERHAIWERGGSRDSFHYFTDVNRKQKSHPPEQGGIALR